MEGLRDIGTGDGGTGDTGTGGGGMGDRGQGLAGCGPDPDSPGMGCRACPGLWPLTPQ